MNEDQMIETAMMLLDECDNMRLEDYSMMFAMAKRGEIGNVFDHIDLQVVSIIYDQYYSRRKSVGMQARESYTGHLDSLGNTTKQIEKMNPQDRKMTEASDKLAAAIEALKMGMTDHEMKHEPIDDQIVKASQQIINPKSKTDGKE